MASLFELLTRAVVAVGFEKLHSQTMVVGGPLPFRAALPPLVLLLACLSQLAPAQTNRPQKFYFQDLGHRCLDFGAQANWAPGVKVNTYSCNSTLAQQVTVTELDNSHDVQLTVQSPYVVYGNNPLFCIGVHEGKVVAGQQLELQLCSQGSPAQRFALDGDSILMGAQPSGQVTREFAVRPRLNSTKLLTPLIVANRDVSDAEYFRYKAVDHSSARPTSGFISVSTESQLDTALKLGWGTVIEINPYQTLTLKGTLPKRIHAGVTLRGYRKYTFQGPDVRACTSDVFTRLHVSRGAFEVFEDNVRITGFRIRGALNDPVCKSDATDPAWDAIMICDAEDYPAPPPDPLTPSCPSVPRVIVDHMDISYFTLAAVDVLGLDPAPPGTCPSPPLPFPRDTPVRVIGNFIHHNNGNGSINGHGAFVLNRGNVFYLQHAQPVDSDGWANSGFIAVDNLFLSDDRGTGVLDMHGALCDPYKVKGNKTACHWQGGNSGDYFEIGWNTVLKAKKGYTSVLQRGTPCRFTTIHDNVFLLPDDRTAIQTYSADPARQQTWSNTYAAKNPTADLAVGDFDGDGIDDVFVGSGEDWYFSSGGQSEWRFLNRMPEHASALLFGDFDGDGRTDIVASHGKNIDISWGGASPWQTINTTALAISDLVISDLAVGDFDGDGMADLFLATGKEWLYSSTGSKAWMPFASSSYRTQQLRFGDFTNEGRTQALRIHEGQWQVAGIQLSWKDIGSAPVSSVDGLVVGDFDGDGLADVARTNKQSGFLNTLPAWEYLTPAHGDSWKTLRTDSNDIASLPIGRFDDNRTSDVVLWNDLHFSFAPSGKNPVKNLSNQDMR